MENTSAKEMTELAHKQASFWYDYKFVNPVTKKIQVKDYYCETLSSTTGLRRRLPSLMMDTRRSAKRRVTFLSRSDAQLDNGEAGSRTRRDHKAG